MLKWDKIQKQHIEAVIMFVLEGVRKQIWEDLQEVIPKQGVKDDQIIAYCLKEKDILVERKAYVNAQKPDLECYISGITHYYSSKRKYWSRGGQGGETFRDEIGEIVELY